MSKSHGLPPRGWRRYGASARQRTPGVLICITIALAATFIADHYGGPTLLYALLFGMS